MNDNIKAIIFDLGGVILNIDMNHCFGEIAKLGVDLKAFNEANKSSGQGAVVCEGVSVGGVLEHYQEGKIDTAAFIVGLKALCKSGTTDDEVVEAWNSCLLDIPEERLDMILKLRKKYKIYLLSNTNDLHWIDIVGKNFSEKGHTTEEYFDKVFLSHEMKIAKPKSDIYRQVLSEIGEVGENCLFIDDSTANLDAAGLFGIHTMRAEDGMPLDYLNSLLDE